MKLVRATSWALTAQYLAFVIQFATSLYLSRTYIAPDSLGAFSIAAAIVAIVTSFQDFGLIRYLVGLRRVGRAERQSAFGLSLLLAIAALILCGMAAGIADYLYRDRPAASAQLAGLILLLGSAGLFIPFALLPIVTLQRRMNFRALAAIDLGAAGLNALCTIWLAQQGFGALALAAGAVAQQGGRAVFANARMPHRWPSSFQRASCRPALRYGGTSSLLNMAWLCADRAPDLLLGYRLGDLAVGLFARAQGLTAVLRQLLSNATTGVFYAAFARAHAQGAPLAPLYERTVSAFCALTWPAFAGLAILAEPVLMLLFGPNWVGAAPALHWLALSQIFFVALPLHVELPMLLDRGRALLWRGLIDSALSIATMAVGVRFGLEAAAASRFGFGVIWFALHAAQICPMLNLGWHRLARIYAQSLMMTLAAIAPAFLAILWRDPSDLGVGMIAATIGIGVVFWVGVAFAAKHPVAALLARLAGQRPRFESSASHADA